MKNHYQAHKVGFIVRVMGVGTKQKVNNLIRYEWHDDVAKTETGKTVG